ncbi:hypothetical protein [Alkanindiges illinoisensis]|uniref:hypothetical protein n=1 Tax=Alkanindiges illinoisensis TaxID=197183 RepID=UPI0004794385|nr:hypothetical protein [Alkanindiges illinoisensis]
MSFQAFKDNSASMDIGGLTLENNEERVSIYGSLNIGRDQQGLQQARQLQGILADMVSYLEQQDLPAQIEAFTPKAAKNPFLDNE